MDYFEASLKAGSIVISEGDMIYCGGNYLTIKKIFENYVSVSRNDNGEYELHCSVEFEDGNGVFRSWKSEFDGGFVMRTVVKNYKICNELIFA